MLIIPYISAESSYTGNVSADSIGGAVLLSLGEGATWNGPTSNIHIWILIGAQPKRQVFKTKPWDDFIVGSV